MTKKSFPKLLMVTTTALLLLSSCEAIKIDWSKLNPEKEADNCPVVGITPDLGNITQMRGTQVVSETIISSVKPKCTLADKTDTVRLAIDFKGRLGPEGVKDASSEANYSIPYLIAVLDPKGTIISKDIFAITMTYKQNQTEQSFSDLLEQVIPLKEGEKPSDYKIMLGFQLDDDQLAYNRALSAAKSNGSLTAPTVSLAPAKSLEECKPLPAIAPTPAKAADKVDKTADKAAAPKTITAKKPTDTKTKASP